MKPATRGLLIGCGSVVLLGVAFAVALVVWFRGHGDELMARGKAAQAAGAPTLAPGEREALAALELAGTARALQRRILA
jgi:hypothetical protein